LKERESDEVSNEIKIKQSKKMKKKKKKIGKSAGRCCREGDGEYFRDEKGDG
jgi:hypothetical protein